MNFFLRGLTRLRETSRRWLIEEQVFPLNILGFVLTALPAIPPITNQELEAKSINLHARLEAYTQISEIHLVLVGVRKQKTKMAGNGEQKVVVEG
jgi:hypothetical protein